VFGDPGAQPECSGPLLPPSFAFCIAEVPARSGVGAGRGMGSAGGFGDLAAGAEAFVDQARVGQGGDGGAVEGEAVRLAEHVAVPCKPDGGQILEYLVLRSGAGAVQILDP
jgi:hypothetical protein